MRKYSQQALLTDFSWGRRRKGKIKDKGLLPERMAKQVFGGGGEDREFSFVNVESRVPVEH